MEERSDKREHLRSRLFGASPSPDGGTPSPAMPDDDRAAARRARLGAPVDAPVDAPASAPSVEPSAAADPAAAQSSSATSRLWTPGAAPAAAAPPAMPDVDEIRAVRERLDFDGFIEPHEAPVAPAAVPERRAFHVLATLAALGIVLAVASSWVTPSGFSLVGHRVVVRPASAGATETAAPPLPKGPAKMLPSQIIQYETIELHAVPGSRGTSAEAIYQTYDMDAMAMAASVIYGRVDGYPTEADAREAFVRLTERYPVDIAEIPLQKGITAQLGYSKDRRVQVAAWQTGRYVTWVKTSFTNPANGLADEKKTQRLLDRVGNAVYRTVAIYQARGLEGTKANAALFGPGAKKDFKPASTPALDEAGKPVGQ